MEEKEITPEQSLQIIEKMLADTRHKFYNNGFAFLLWGVIIIAACIAEFIAIKMGHENYSNTIWLISLVGGMTISVVYYAFIAKKKRTFSRLDSINGKLWISFGISYVVLIFLCIQLKTSTAPFIYCLLGLGMFASGGIYKFWSLYAGAIIFWTGAIACVIFKSEIECLFISIIIMFLGYLVPGYLLWRKAKKEANV